MRIRLFLFLLLFLATLPAGAEAKSSPRQLIPLVPAVVATYDIYVGGAHLMTADIHFQEQPGLYKANLIAHTRGIWYRLFPWDSELLVRGTIRKDRFMPIEYATHDIWGKKIKTANIHFGKKGKVTTEFTPAQNDDNRDSVTNEQKRNALDPISALLQMLAHLAISKDCNVTVPVFDGKMLFDVTGTETGVGDTDPDDYGIFKGSARTCDGSFTLVAGADKEKIKAKFWKKNEHEQGREPFHIWLAKPDPALPELPVRLETGSMWGNVVIHLSRWGYDK